MMESIVREKARLPRMVDFKLGPTLPAVVQAWNQFRAHRPFYIAMKDLLRRCDKLHTRYSFLSMEKGSGRIPWIIKEQESQATLSAMVALKQWTARCRYTCAAAALEELLFSPDITKSGLRANGGVVSLVNSEDAEEEVQHQHQGPTSSGMVWTKGTLDKVVTEVMYQRGYNTSPTVAGARPKPAVAARSTPPATVATGSTPSATVAGRSNLLATVGVVSGGVVTKPTPQVAEMKTSSAAPVTSAASLASFSPQVQVKSEPMSPTAEDTGALDLQFEVKQEPGTSPHSYNGKSATAAGGGESEGTSTPRRVTETAEMLDLPVTCRHCHVDLSTEAMISNHAYEHDDEAYICRLCQSNFDTSDDAILHARWCRSEEVKDKKAGISKAQADEGDPDYEEDKEEDGGGDEDDSDPDYAPGMNSKRRRSRNSRKSGGVGVTKEQQHSALFRHLTEGTGVSLSRNLAAALNARAAVLRQSPSERAPSHVSLGKPGGEATSPRHMVSLLNNPLYQRLREQAALQAAASREVSPESQGSKSAVSAVTKTPGGQLTTSPMLATSLLKRAIEKASSSPIPSTLDSSPDTPTPPGVPPTSEGPSMIPLSVDPGAKGVLGQKRPPSDAVALQVPAKRVRSRRDRTVKTVPGPDPDIPLPLPSAHGNPQCPNCRRTFQTRMGLALHVVGLCKHDSYFAKSLDSDTHERVSSVRLRELCGASGAWQYTCKNCQVNFSFATAAAYHMCPLYQQWLRKLIAQLCSNNPTCSTCKHRYMQGSGHNLVCGGAQHQESSDLTPGVLAALCPHCRQRFRYTSNVGIHVLYMCTKPVFELRAGGDSAVRLSVSALRARVKSRQIPDECDILCEQCGVTFTEGGSAGNHVCSSWPNWLRDTVEDMAVTTEDPPPSAATAAAAAPPVCDDTEPPLPGSAGGDGKETSNGAGTQRKYTVKCPQCTRQFTKPWSVASHVKLVCDSAVFRLTHDCYENPEKDMIESVSVRKLRDLAQDKAAAPPLAISCTLCREAFLDLTSAADHVCSAFPHWLKEAVSEVSWPKKSS